MSVTLTQSGSAAFPDRGGVGLMAVLSPGGSGRHLAVTLEQLQAVLCVRWLMRLVDLSGGPVVVAAGFDDSGAETFRVTLDPDAQQITVDLATGDTLAGELSPALQWHAVELGIDTNAGNVTLRINGVQRDTADGAFTSLVTRTCWFGVILKHTDAVGELHLDEWALADEPVGPVRVTPSSHYGDDPARWLVVYNTADAGSVAWVQHYRDARSVPYANLLGLDLPTDETVDEDEYAPLNDAIEQYLADTGLGAQVMGILLGYRVPGYVQDTGSGIIYAVDDLLHRGLSSLNVAPNSHAVDMLPIRPTPQLLGADRLTARIDGPDLAAAIALVDRATTLIEAGPDDGFDTALYLDPFAGSGEPFDTITQDMVEWSLSVDRQRLRLPILWSGPLGNTAPQQFDEVSKDGFFWGWGDASLPPGFFVDPPGRRVVSARFDLFTATATSARDSDNWITAPLTAGYAAAIANSKVISGSAVPLLRPFFEALRLGWTLAEAMYVAKPVLRNGLHLIGDPLLRVNLPRAGWDVFGPLDSLDQLDPQQPTAALRLDEVQFSAAAGEGLYVVRRVDEQGRSEEGLAHVAAVDEAGVAARPIVPPIWPTHHDWPVRVRDGQLELIIAWDRAMDAARVGTIELYGEIDNTAEALIASLPASPRHRFAWLAVDLPDETARFRWRVRSIDGADWWSPWSVMVRPHEPLPAPLQILETNG